MRSALERKGLGTAHDNGCAASADAVFTGAPYI